MLRELIKTSKKLDNLRAILLNNIEKYDNQVLKDLIEIFQRYEKITEKINQGKKEEVLGLIQKAKINQIKQQESMTKKEDQARLQNILLEI